MSTSKSLVLAFIWILLLSFIFILFVYILGALTSKSASADDWDTITDNGIYSVSINTSTSGAPTGAYQWGTLVVVCSTSSGGVRGVVQMYFENATTGGRVWQRNRWQTSDAFRPWVELTTNMPTFYKNYNSLSALVSAVLSNSGESGDYDVDTLTNTGFYYCRSNSTNLPTTSYHHFLLVFAMGSGNVIQIAYNYSLFILYIRTSGNSGSSWSSGWKSITLT